MLMPSIFGENLFDDFMFSPWRSEFFSAPKTTKHVMNTDVRENEDSYELDIELPGYRKEDVSAKLENGYLTSRPAESPMKTRRIRKAITSAESAMRVPAAEASMWARMSSRTKFMLNSRTASEVTVPKVDQKKWKRRTTFPYRDKDPAARRPLHIV